MAEIAEIAEDIFRITLAPPGRPLTYSLFLIRDEAPMLVETSFGRAFDEVSEAVRSLLDPATLRYVVVPHFEADECGALNHFLELAPNAVPLGSPIAARGSLADFGIRPAQAVADSQVLDLGRRRLRFLLTPQVHQWDSLLAFEEQTRTLFSSDLFMQPGHGPALTEQDLTEQMVLSYRQSGLMPSMAHIYAALDKIEPLQPRTLACHHGSAVTGSVVPQYFKALRENDVTSLEPAGYR